MAEQIGRSTERFYLQRDAFVLESQQELESLNMLIQRQLGCAGYKERKYDEWASAFYREGCELRQEPVVLQRWRNGVIDPDKLQIALERAKVGRVDGDTLFIEFDDPKAAEEVVLPGDIHGLSVIIRYSQDARNRIERALQMVFGPAINLADYEDERQTSKDKRYQTRIHSFAFDSQANELDAIQQALGPSLGTMLPGTA